MNSFGNDPYFVPILPAPYHWSAPHRFSEVWNANSFLIDQRNGIFFRHCQVFSSFFIDVDPAINRFRAYRAKKNGFVYVRIEKGMYGLPQAGRIAYGDLKKRLKPFGYAPVKYTHGLWKHSKSNLMFTLVVDDFGIRYTNKDDVDTLLSALQACKYKFSIDWNGTQYVGLTLEWDYDARTVTLSMPGYVERALTGNAHPFKDAPKEDSPHVWRKPNYGQKVQYAKTADDSPLLDKKAKKKVQSIIGSFLYYARAVDETMLKALNTLSTQQKDPTERTLSALIKFMNYAATHPDAKVQFRASDMILHIFSDASYLNESKARSTGAGKFFLNGHPKSKRNPEPSHDNGALDVLCNIIKVVVSSAAESESGSLFFNGQHGVPMRRCLEEMGHPQPATPIQTDNSTAFGIAHDSIKQKRSQAFDMRFFWIRDRQEQGQYNVYWKPGKGNKSDYYTKHHPVAHHRNARPYYVFDPDQPDKYYSPEVNYYAPLDDDDNVTLGTEPDSDSDSEPDDDLFEVDTVVASNCSQQFIRPMSAGEGVSIPQSRGTRCPCVS